MHTFSPIPFMAWKDGRVFIAVDENDKETFETSVEEKDLATLGGSHIYVPIERWFFFKTIQDHITLLKRFSREIRADFDEIKAKRRKDLLPDFIKYVNTVIAVYHSFYERLYNSYFEKDSAMNVAAYCIRNGYGCHEIVKYTIGQDKPFEYYETFDITMRDTLDHAKVCHYFPILRLPIYEKTYPVYSEGIVFRNGELSTTIEMAKTAFHLSKTMEEFKSSCIKLGLAKKSMLVTFPEFSVSSKLTESRDVDQAYAELLTCADKMREYRNKLYPNKGEAK